MVRMRQTQVMQAIMAVLLAGLIIAYNCFFQSMGHASGTVSWSSWKRPTYTVQWQRLNASDVQLTAVAYIIMTSSVTKKLYLGQRRNWLRDARHVWAFSDEYDLGMSVHTLPSIYGKSTWNDAQHRQLRGMQWLYGENERDRGVLHGVEWLFLIDDDTWINMPVFSRFLPLLEKDTSMLCGYQAGNGMFNGGAGILLSRRAFDTITPKLYSDACPFSEANDNTITMCARRSNVTMMHSGMFSFYPSKIDSAVDFIEQITVHPVKDYALVVAMTSTSREFYGSW